MLNEYFKAYEAGGYSPKLLRPEEVEPGTIVFTEEDDNKRLEFARLQIIGTGRKVEVIFVIVVRNLAKLRSLRLKHSSHSSIVSFWWIRFKVGA